MEGTAQNGCPFFHSWVEKGDYYEVRPVCSKLVAECSEGMSSSRKADNRHSDVGCNSPPSSEEGKASPLG